MPAFINRVGKRYGRLTAIRCEPMTKRIRWLCRCDCGTECWVVSDQLMRTESCGCLQRERTSKANTTHGFARPGRVNRTYLAWQKAKRRCLNPIDKRYSSYGGRGIEICSRWVHSFENFLADMGEVPVGMSLERDDVNGHYEPSNCRWATRQEQAENRRPTIWVDFDGGRLTLKAFAELMGVSYQALHYRVRYRKQNPHRAVKNIVRR